MTDSRSIERLQELCRIPSVTSDRASVALAVDWLVKTYGPLSEGTDIFCDSAGDVVGVLLRFGRPGRARVVFYNYIDVATPGEESAWARPPFSAALHDGRLYARGAASNKGDLVARLEAVAELSAAGELAGEVVVWVDAAEESGSAQFAGMVDRWRAELQAPLVLWNTGFVNVAGEPVIACGFKGLLITLLAAQASGYTGHSGVGVGSSAIRALLGIVQPLLDDADLAGLLPARAHSDEDSESARLIEESRLFEGLDPRRTLLESTANVPWFDGGNPQELTRYPPSAACALELRLVAPHRTEAALAAIVARCQPAGIQCTPVIQAEPYALQPDQRTAIFAALSGPLSRAFQGTPRLLPVAPFSAHASSVSEASGAMVVSVGLTDSDSAPHASNESISCDLFMRTKAFVAALVGN